MKKFLVILSLGFVLAVTGCGSTPAESEAPAKNDAPSVSTEAPKPSVSYKEGTYEGTSDAGMHEGLKVSVTVKEGRIAEVKVLEHHETDGVGSTAVERLPGTIVEAQSTEVDNVTGASLSSGAIKEAVNKALEQAK